MDYHDQALLIAILETAVDAIVLIDQSGIIQTVNSATTRMFGFSKQELLGQNVSMLMPSPFREHHDSYLKNYLESGQPKIIGIGREVVGKRKDGSTFPMHLAVSQLQIGERRMFAGIVRDISDLKDAQESLAHANEQLEQRVRKRTEELHAAQAELLKSERLATLGQVSGGIAHEIRNPLNAVRTSVYYLRNAKTPTKEKVAEHLERIDRQVSMIDSVVTALSDIARLPEPVLQQCDVSELLRNVLASVTIPDAIAVEMDLPDSVVVYSDPNQISIVFRNLIRNARDAMPDQGTLRFSFIRTEDEVVIQVADTGIGIEPSQIEQIMEPLFSTKARGMGLGLAISVAILTKNQGKLSVESEPGAGATFSVHLKPAENDSSDNGSNR